MVRIQGRSMEAVMKKLAALATRSQAKITFGDRKLKYT